MAVMTFPVIDPIETGRNIVRLRQARGLSVRDVQRWFNFDEPRAIYKWQSGKTLPSVDNLFALSALLEVSMNEILVAAGNRASCAGSQVHACDPVVFGKKLPARTSCLRRELFINDQWDASVCSATYSLSAISMSSIFGSLTFKGMLSSMGV